VASDAAIGLMASSQPSTATVRRLLLHLVQKLDMCQLQDKKIIAFLAGHDRSVLRHRPQQAKAVVAQFGNANSESRHIAAFGHGDLNEAMCE